METAGSTDDDGLRAWTRVRGVAAPHLETETWPDMFPLPDGYSLEPQPLTEEQIGELTMLFRS